MVPNVLRRLLEGVLTIQEIVKYKKIEGDLQNDDGIILKQGGSKPKVNKTTINNNIENQNTKNNNDNRVAVNNFFQIKLNLVGEETMDHITSDDMVSCYDDDSSRGIVGNFSDILYSDTSNLNFRSGPKDSLCKAFTASGWGSEPKDSGYEVLYQNITSKSLEAMDLFGDDITDDMKRRHRREVEDLDNMRIETCSSIRGEYVKYRNDRMNLLGENIKNKISNYALKNGKRMKFV